MGLSPFLNSAHSGGISFSLPLRGRCRLPKKSLTGFSDSLRLPARGALFYAFSTSAQKVSICFAMMSRAPRQKFLSVRSMPATLAVSSAEATVVV